MTYAPQTPQTLSKLTWNEIRALHSIMGLKATKTTATRAHYEARILAEQPQTITESAPVTMTCATCPLARHIDSDRYCCTVPQTANDVKRGHWEATISCEEAIAQAEAEAQEVSVTPATEFIAEVETPIAPVSPAPLTAEENTESPLSPYRIWTIDEIEEKMSKLKADVLAGCRPATKPSEAHIKLKSRPFRAYVAPELEPETIVWKTPFQGEILGKRGEIRPFFVENDIIYVVIQSRTSLFCAIEGRHQNYHHTVIRQAVSAGKTFDPAAFKQLTRAHGCPSPKYFTYWWKDAGGQPCNLGQLYQNCDGWWWAWSNQQRTEGKKFLTKALAQKYLQLEYAERPYKFIFAEGVTK